MNDYMIKNKLFPSLWYIIKLDGNKYLWLKVISSERTSRENHIKFSLLFRQTLL